MLMADWVDYLTAKEAKHIADNPTSTRYPARDDRGQSVTRYTAPTKAELERIRTKVNG